MSDELEQTGSITAKLVAYLDGELPETAARDVEQSLASDPEVRAEVERLNRAWELLDLLPRPTASGEFSSRTLTTLKTLKIADAPTGFDYAEDPAATVLVKKQSPNYSVSKRLLVWIAGLLLVTLLSFFGGRFWQRTAPDPLVDDLPLIENLDLYREIGDAEFLRDFQHGEPFDDRPPPPRR